VSPPRRRRSGGRANQNRSNANRSNANRSNARRRAAPGRDFWGPDEPDDDDEVLEVIHPIDDPTGLIRSLGPIPLPGHETAAEHYFAAVFDKAATLGVALAAASGLLAGDEEDDDEPTRRRP